MKWDDALHNSAADKNSQAGTNYHLLAPDVGQHLVFVIVFATDLYRYAIGDKMQLLKCKSDFEKYRDEIFPHEKIECPKRYPCFVYEIVQNLYHEETTPVYLYKTRLKEMLSQLHSDGKDRADLDEQFTPLEWIPGGLP